MSDATVCWEYTQIASPTNAGDELVQMLDALGSVGWEAVGLTGVDKTIGLNAVMVLLKRQLVGLPAPADDSAGWKDDPSGRFASRWWDGLRWERHVSNDGGSTRGVDLPQRGDAA